MTDQSGKCAFLKKVGESSIKAGKPCQMPSLFDLCLFSFFRAEIYNDVVHVMSDPPFSCCRKVNLVRHPDYTCMICKNVVVLFLLI